MKKAILSMTILFLAGCSITALSKKKEEGLNEMPITQVAPQKDEALPQIELMPVTQVVEKIEEKEKLYSLSAKDMEIREILFLLAGELPEYTVDIHPDVSGRRTVDIKELSLDNILTILLEPLGLEYTMFDHILRISKPRMVTRTFEFVYSTTNRTAKTSLVAMTGGGGETTGGEGAGSSSASFGSIATEETIDVWGELESGIISLLSEAGKLSISKRIGRISVTDYRSNMKEIASFIDAFKRETKIQILIKAKILEVTLTEGSEFGIDWTAVFNGINILGGSETDLIKQSFAPADSAVTTFGLSFAKPINTVINHDNLKLVIRALETQGKVTVLSSPQVSTLNGQKAIIRSVREDVIFQSSQSAGGAGDPIATTTAEPFTFGVFLDVTPHVDSEGMITMDVHPSVSSKADPGLSPDGTAQKPIIDTRETETVVTVKNGETVIIAGLMQDNVQKLVSKFPLLGDIPYLGKAFRREITETQKSELVILISPTIVGPRAKDFGNARANYKMLRDQFPDKYQGVVSNPFN